MHDEIHLTRALHKSVYRPGNDVLIWGEVSRHGSIRDDRDVTVVVIASGDCFK